MPKRSVSMSVLPGEPTDGSGRTCIHLFVRDPKGPFVEPHTLSPVVGADGQLIKQRLQAGPARGRLACDSKRTVAPVTCRGVTIVTQRTDDPQAVTCPKCIASKDYVDRMKENTERVKEN